MSKAEKFIQERTKNCSNAIYDPYDTGDAITIYAPWLSPDQALKSVEIARKEIYEWLRVNLCDYFDAPRSMFEICLEDLKQAIKDE